MKILTTNCTAILVFPLLLLVCIARGEHLSTVFVLETSDSDSVANNAAPFKEPESANTKIITDESTPVAVQPTSVQQHHSQNQHQKQHLNESQIVVISHHSPSGHNNHTKVQPTIHHNSQNHHNQTHSQQSHPNNSNQHHNSSSQEPHSNHNQSSSRRLTDETQPNSHNQPKVQVSHPAQHHPHRPKTTTASYEEQPSSSESPPKTEERLLISISSSDDDDDNYKAPAKQQSGLSFQDAPVIPPHHHKRKPSITISIQDASIIKQIGGDQGSSLDAPAVIVRPSENGQSIVISTQQLQKPPSKPHHQTSPSQHQQNSNHLNPTIAELPYREPANVPQPMHQPAHSTTHRPQVVHPSRGPVSTLVEPSRLNQLSDERPQRPVASLEETSFDQSTVSKPTRQPASSNQYQSNDQSYEPSPVTSNNQEQVEPRYPLSDKNCGLMHETRIVGGDEANPDDFLWMAAIIKSKPKEGEAKPFCGGSLITRRHILTAAHCLEGLAPRDVLVRLGSYDFDDSTASSLSADYAIDQFRVPAQYSKKTHVADIAIMRLKTPLATTDNYKTVCMPQPRRSYVGALGTVTGYGSQSETFRRATPKLRQVTVPIWENRKCSSVYKRNLTESFLCAGYEEGGKDACQGDSGGPLMTDGPNERMMLVGVVSHGIGCGSPGYPGVYTRTTTYLEWIEKNTRE